MLKKLILLLAVYSAAAVCQPFEVVSKQIFKKLVAIENQLSQLTKKERALGSFDSDDTHLTLYYQGKQLKKAVIYYADIGSNKVDHYYFANNQLFLCRSLVQEQTDETEAKNTTANKAYYLYQQGSILRPPSSGQVQQTYMIKAKQKRNKLISALALSAF